MMSGARTEWSGGGYTLDQTSHDGRKKESEALILVAGGQHHRGKDQRALIRFTDPFFG